MSNILIIKHGSLGDLIQANGAIKDIKNFYKNRKVFLLTAQPYAIFMSCLLYTSPSPRDLWISRMPSSA